MIVLAVFALLVVGAIAVLLVTRGGDESNSTAAGKSTTTLPVTAATSRTTIASTTTENTLPGQPLAEWNAEHQSDLVEVGTILQAVGDAGNARDGAGVVAACEDFASWVRRMQATAPIADPAVNEPWQSALTDGLSAADDCIAAGPNLDQAQLDQFRSHMNDFEDHLLDFTDQLLES